MLIFVSSTPVAIFDDASKVEFVGLNVPKISKYAFSEIDLLARNTT